jgi:hypothetical protein
MDAARSVRGRERGGLARSSNGDRYVFYYMLHYNPTKKLSPDLPLSRIGFFQSNFTIKHHYRLDISYIKENEM